MQFPSVTLDRSLGILTIEEELCRVLFDWYTFRFLLPDHQFTLVGSLVVSRDLFEPDPVCVDHLLCGVLILHSMLLLVVEYPLHAILVVRAGAIVIEDAVVPVMPQNLICFLAVIAQLVRAWVSYSDLHRFESSSRQTSDQGVTADYRKFLILYYGSSESETRRKIHVQSDEIIQVNSNIFTIEQYSRLSHYISASTVTSYYTSLTCF